MTYNSFHLVIKGKHIIHNIITTKQIKWHLLIYYMAYNSAKGHYMWLNKNETILYDSQSTVETNHSVKLHLISVNQIKLHVINSWWCRTIVMKPCEPFFEHVRTPKQLSVHDHLSKFTSVPHTLSIWCYVVGILSSGQYIEGNLLIKVQLKL